MSASNQSSKYMKREKTDSEKFFFEKMTFFVSYILELLIGFGPKQFALHACMRACSHACYNFIDFRDYFDTIPYIYIYI